MQNVLETSKHRRCEGAETEEMCKLQRRAPGRHKDDAELQSGERYSFGYEFGTSILKQPDGATEAPAQQALSAALLGRGAPSGPGPVRAGLLLPGPLEAEHGARHARCAPTPHRPSPRAIVEAGPHRGRSGG